MKKISTCLKNARFRIVKQTVGCVQTSNEKFPVFRFLCMNDERDTWIRTIPYKNHTIGIDSVIFEKHWPESYRKISRKGRQRPN